MPTLHLKITPRQTPERHSALAAALTALTAQYLGKRSQVTAVVIDDLPAAQFYVGGREAALPTAWLEIAITEGTNTADEKAAFIRAAFQELQRQLADGQSLEEASYVSVHELPAGDWGYGGRTQLARRLAREAADQPK